MAAAGVPIWDASTPEGSAFAEEIAGLSKFSNEMKGYEQDINEIEGIKGADQDAYKFYVDQIGKAKDPTAVDAIVTSYRENKDLLAKAPDLPKAVAATVNATAKNKDIVDIGKLGKFDKLTIKSSIPDEKVQDIFEVAKNSEASKLEEQLYDFKQKNAISDPEFDKFNSYDEYLMDKVKDQIALTASENDQLRSQWQINISNNTGGGTQTTGQGNPIYVRPGDANKQFQALDRYKQLDKGNSKYVAISVDPSVLQKTGQTSDMILDEGGSRYIKLDELWRFPDKSNPGAVQDISWVWTNAAKTQPGAWSPKEGNYKTPSGLDVNGKPVELLWDQDGNAWATIETTKGDKVRVLVYDTEENVFGAGSPATNSIKGNAQAFLGTFTDAGALLPGVLNNTRASIAKIFDKTEGLIPGEVE
jgi:hypothetical protein